MVPPFLLLVLCEHFASSSKQPSGTYSVLPNHRLKPGNLKPATIKIFSLGYKVSPVYFVQPTVGVYASDLFALYNGIQGTIEAFHNLFAHCSIHLFK